MTGAGRSRPLISLIVPVYNVADHVGACIASLKAQTLTDFEVIVVDDGSTDDSAARLRSAIDGDPRFEVIRQANGGLSAARNTGLARVRAPVIGFVDSDDRVDPDYLSAMYAELERSGADWVSCGILFCAPDADPVPHSGLHDAGKLEDTAPPERHDLSNWCEVVRHFPSAWNKLYRASLIDGLRFDEGMLYEDHAFYWQAAARTDHLVRLNRPLYLQTQGRAGQITGDASDAVFQQFDVLDRLVALAEGLDRAEVPRALTRIATRLSFERVVPLRDRVRRARFVARARAWLAGRGMVPDLTLSVPVWWGDVLEGAVPVSVVVPSDGALAPLAETLSSLANQTLAEAEILVVPDEGQLAGPGRADLYAAAAVHPDVSVLAGARGVHGARNRGLEAARGRYVVFLDAGDRLPPHALAQWAGRLGATGAAVGFGPMRMGPDQIWHPGLHDRDGIAPARLEAMAGFAPTPADGAEIHGHPSSKIFARALLDRHGLRFAAGPLSSTLFLLAALGRAERATYLRTPPFVATRPECRRLWRAPDEAETLWQALAGVPPALQARLWARMVWEKVNHADFPAPHARARFEDEVRILSAKLDGLQGARLDPFVGPRVRTLLGVPRG